MVRLYIKGNFLTARSCLQISDEQKHYLDHVMRLKSGDEVCLFDGISGEWIGQVVRNGKKLLHILCISCIKQQAPNAPSEDLVLAFGITKGASMEYIVQKATELGVGYIVPCITQRTVARPKNTYRMEAIAIEAAEQCERMSVPVIYQPTSLDKLNSVMENIGCDSVIICDPRSGKSPEDIMPIINRNKRNLLVIGPEGGLSDQEICILQKYPKAYMMKYGDNVLKADTAAIAAVIIYNFVR